MSVIAKLVIRGVHTFGTGGQMVDLSCLCDNDLMKAYAEDHEDKLFTEYSPWGEMKLHQPPGYTLGQSLQQDDAFYVMIVSKDEISDGFTFPGAYAYSQLRVDSITDYGDGQAKRLEMCTGYIAKKLPVKGIENFNWKMSVDNPAVFSQMNPGTEDYFVAFYPAASFDRNAAIAAAHGA